MFLTVRCTNKAWQCCAIHCHQKINKQVNLMGFVPYLIHKILSVLKEPIFAIYNFSDIPRWTLILSKFNHIKVVVLISIKNKEHCKNFRITSFWLLIGYLMWKQFLSGSIFTSTLGRQSVGTHRASQKGYKVGPDLGSECSCPSQVAGLESSTWRWRNAKMYP